MKTGMKAWVAQRARDIEKRGRRNAAWFVFWNDPSGRRRQKSCGSGKEGWRLAQKEAQRLHGKLITGEYVGCSGRLWEEFRQEYDPRILDGMEPGTRRCTEDALKHFERIVLPGMMAAIRTDAIDLYIAKRRKERGRKKGDLVSAATINKELRHIKAVLHVASDWGYLAAVPKIKMLKEPHKLPRYVSVDRFAVIYEACDAATLPRGLPYSAAEWWRALLTFMYMTGWRISEPLALRRMDVDLDKGAAITRHRDNKGRRDDLIPLHPVVVEHLLRIKSFDQQVFPWPHRRDSLWDQFRKIQQAAGIHLPCPGDHEHTDACHLYGFHDLRRGFATLNARHLGAEALQRLMRHKSYTTTQLYINMASQLNSAVESLHVPDGLKKA